MTNETRYPYQDATEEQKSVGAWWWCVHHQIHLEPLTEAPENRAKYIREYKPENERDRRLREFRPVLHPERIPERILKAGAEYAKAWAQCAKARAEYGKAGAEYAKAWAEYDKAGAEYDKARAEYAKARAECAKALDEYDKAWAEYDKAWAEHAKARAACEPELMALHREEYPDTQWNGKSIFGGQK